MFPADVPERQLAKAPKSAVVLDPFCGRGTTNYVARMKGLASVGVDSSPVAVAIAQGKLTQVTAAEVVNECRSILSEPSVAQPSSDFWSLCFHEETLAALAILRNALLHDCSTPVRKALRALLLGALHGPRNKHAPSYFSNQMPRSFAPKPDYAVRFWTRSDLKPERIDMLALVSRRAARLFTGELPTPPSRIVQADSRVVDFKALGRFTHVVTSPPYYGMKTYLADQWLRYWFVGGPDHVPYASVPWQMGHSSPEDFAKQLGQVWAGVAKACGPEAKWMIRFGGIRDRLADPKAVLLMSLRESGAPIRVVTTRSAGTSIEGKRQATQFQRNGGGPVEEFDLYVRMEG